jgi:hypothetical protein
MRPLIKQEYDASNAPETQEMDGEEIDDTENPPVHRELDVAASARGHSLDDGERIEARHSGLQRAHADFHVEAFRKQEQETTNQGELVQCGELIDQLQTEMALNDTALSARNAGAIANGSASAANFQVEMASLQTELRMKCEQLDVCKTELSRMCCIIQVKDELISRLQAESHSQRRVKVEVVGEDDKPYASEAIRATSAAATGGTRCVQASGPGFISMFGSEGKAKGKLK